MKLKTKLLKAMNEQINHELYSAYLYLSMAAWFESKNLKGFSHWMKKQAAEEQQHAMKFFGHIIERGDKVELKTIQGPQISWKSSEEVFGDSLRHEQKVTALIHHLVDIAHAEKDYPSMSMLQWFVDEQVEEEGAAEDIIEKLKMVKGSTQGLYMLDRELSRRE